MSGDLHDAAFRAGVWSVIEARAKELKEQAKFELQALEVGDAVAGKWDGKVLAKATRTKGRSKLVVTDEQKLLDWVTNNHPTEVQYSVNPAFLKALEAKAKEMGVGAVIDNQGEVVPGVEIVEGDSYITVRKDKEAPFLVAQLLRNGALSLDGVQDTPALPEPTDRYSQDREAGGL